LVRRVPDDRRGINNDTSRRWKYPYTLPAAYMLVNRTGPISLRRGAER
jgi:hypothetical protein